MKFSRQLEEYQLPEWEAHYLPYNILKKRLYDIVYGPFPLGPETEEQLRGLLAEKGATPKGLSAGSWRRTPASASVPHDLCSLSSSWNINTDDNWERLTSGIQPPPLERVTSGTSDVLRLWRRALEVLGARISLFVDRGLRNLAVQFDDLSAMGTENEESPGKSWKIPQLRVLEALGRVAEGVAKLRGFAEINHAAFYKILKKHDKILKSSDGLTVIYPRLIEATCLGNVSRFDELDAQVKKAYLESATLRGLEASPEVARLCAGLGGGNVTGSTGRGNLATRSDRVLFFFLGCAVTSIVAIVLLIVLPPPKSKSYDMAYFLANFCVFRLALAINLMMWGMGAVSQVCEDNCINHMFLLDIDPRCRVGPQWLFGIAAMLTSVWVILLGAYVVDYKWFVLDVNNRARARYAIYPFSAASIAFASLLCPSKIFRIRYRASMANCIKRVCAAPLFAVPFCDNMIGDVMTSLAWPIKDAIHSICYVMADHPLQTHVVDRFSAHGDTCPPWMSQNVCFFVGTPYWFRLCQCARRYYDTKETKHLWNFGKYTTSLAVVLASRVTDNTLLVVVVSVAATIYAACWDIAVDWGVTDILRNSLPGDQEILHCTSVTDLRQSFKASPSSHINRDSVSERPSRARSRSNSPSRGRSQSPLCIAEDCLPIQRLTSKASICSNQTGYQSQYEDQAAPERLFGARVYWSAAVLDVIARLTWVLTLLPITIISDNIVQRAVIETFISAAEVSRRSMWAVLRMEHEQVANASGFRALLWVPKRMHQNASGGATTADDKPKKDKKDKKDKKEKKEKGHKLSSFDQLESAQPLLGH